MKYFLAISDKILKNCALCQGAERVLNKTVGSNTIIHAPALVIPCLGTRPCHLMNGSGVVVDPKPSTLPQNKEADPPIALWSWALCRAGRYNSPSKVLGTNSRSGSPELPNTQALRSAEPRIMFSSLSSAKPNLSPGPIQKLCCCA